MDSPAEIFPEISGIGAVLPDSEPSPFEIPEELGDPTLAFQCPASPGKGILAPNVLRRLGRAQRMALTATHLSLEDAGIVPNARENIAVCIGTAWGEIGSTYTFLENMILKDEQQPKPSAFVNSVHNSIASQIAISLKCKGENHTTIHSSISFENALSEAAKILQHDRAEQVVVCGVDELNGYIIATEQAAGRLPANGVIKSMILPGEGAVALLLAKPQSSSNNPKIRSIRTRPWPPDRLTVPSKDPEVRFIRKALDAARINPVEIDLVLCTSDGTPEQYETYGQIIEALSKSSEQKIPYGTFQHTTGNFRTASAAGIMFAAQSIRSEKLADAIHCETDHPRNPARRILVYTLASTGFQSACVISR